MTDYMTVTLVVGYEPATQRTPDEWDWPTLIDGAPTSVGLIEAWATESDEMEKAFGTCEEVDCSSVPMRGSVYCADHNGRVAEDGS